MNSFPSKVPLRFADICLFALALHSLIQHIDIFVVTCLDFYHSIFWNDFSPIRLQFTFNVQRDSPILKWRFKVPSNGQCCIVLNLWSHWLLLFWTSCVLPHWFQIQSGSLACTLSCLCVVIRKVMSGAKPAFSTNRCVHCKSVHMAWQLSLFDPHTCSHQMYLQALEEPWPGPGFKATTTVPLLSALNQSATPARHKVGIVPEIIFHFY